MTASFLFAALCAGEGWASGQIPAASSPAIFGGAATREDKGQGLAGLVELFHAYDDNVLAGEGGGNPSRPANENGVGGMYSGLSLAAMYQAGREGPVFRSWVNSMVRYYPKLSNLTAAYHHVGATLAQPLGRRFNLQVNSSASYSPNYSMQLFPDERDPETIQERFVLTPDDDYAILRGESIRFAGNAALNMTVSDQSSLNVRYGYGKSTFDGRAADLEVRNAGVGFSHRFSRNASLRLGYSRQDGNYESSRRGQIENIYFGVDYRRTLSRSRRTFVHFSSGSVLAEDGVDRRRLQVTGSASLAHQIGRTWIANIDYRRNARHIEGFEQPIFSDSAMASIGGLLTRRLEFSMSTAYFAGTVGVRSTSPRFDNYSSSARLRTALSRTLAAYLEYRLYHYKFADDALRPLGAPPAYDRSGVRVGLSWYVPLID